MSIQYDENVDMINYQRTAVQVAQSIKSLVQHGVLDNYIILVQPTRPHESGLHQLLETRVKLPVASRPLTVKEARALNSVLSAAIFQANEWDRQANDDFLEGLLKV